ncbi:MAG: hypothetical protein RJB66_1007 [Pseudomonadota bacterium]|jgi:hypothetical protein
MKSSLIPFQSSLTTLKFETDSKISGQNLEITYKLSGALENINLLHNFPSKKNRKNELWKDTCFEWFIGSKTNSQYWEFNASPSGEWNFYQLDDYRKNLTECEHIGADDINFSSQSLNEDKCNYSFKMNIALNSLLRAQPNLIADGALALTAVIRTNLGATDYYSLKHPSEKPDFHNRTGFIIPLKELE